MTNKVKTPYFGGARARGDCLYGAADKRNRQSSNRTFLTCVSELTLADPLRRLWSQGTGLELLFGLIHVQIIQNAGFSK